MKADLVEFTEILKELMCDNDLNIKQLSARVGVSSKSVSYWFQGAFYPNLESLIKIADFFHTSIDYLFGKTDILTFCASAAGSNFITRYNLLKQSNHMTDYRVAKLCGIGNSTIAKWQIHNKIPESDTLIKLSTIFGCSIEYLIGRA